MSVETPFVSLYAEVLNTLLPNSLQFMITGAPVLLFIFLFVIFWDLWVDYVRCSNFLATKYTVLELKLPKETFKSPQAMEVFLNSLHNTADGNFYAQYWNGETRPWYSLELISIEGAVKFMIWTEDRRKSNLMSALYSQFPEIEVKEVEDYTRSVHFDPNQIRIWGAEFKFASKEKAHPLKTYVDYGLDKDPKEEFKVDPLVPFIEFLGSVPPNQQVWIQILIRAHLKDRRKKGSIFEKEDSWVEESKKLVNDMMKRDPKTKVAGTKDEATGFTKLPSISEGEKAIIDAVERRVTKQAFDVGIRTLYISKKDAFSMPFGVGGIMSNIKHFSAPHMNSFKPEKKWHPLLDYPWQDFRNMRRNKFGRQVLSAYRQRSYFYAPFKRKPLVMNSEELATLYHFPGSVSKAPNLERVPSKKSEAPGNLPI
jgi:hypothetical protein